MPQVILEDTDGRLLAEIDAADVPRVGEFVQTVHGLHRVVSVIWDLVDGPLVSVRVLIDHADPE